MLVFLAFDQILLDRQQILLTFMTSHLILALTLSMGGSPLFLGLLAFLTVEVWRVPLARIGVLGN